MLHRSFGLTILLLTGLRLAWRQCVRLPSLRSELPPVQRRTARLTVIALYTLLLAQPVLGLTGSMLHGDRITIFGTTVVPDTLALRRAIADRVFALHGWTALLLLSIIGVHAAAALFHHFVRHDDVLSGMLPIARRRVSPAIARAGDTVT